MHFSRSTVRLAACVVGFAMTAPGMGAAARISKPTALFNLTTTDMLGSTDICLSGGSAFGMETGKALIRNIAVGLGGIAEAEISTMGLSNRLTGRSESFSMSSFKVGLIPKGWRWSRFLPDLVVQLKSSNWKNLETEQRSIRPYYLETASYDGQNLNALNTRQRFSVLQVLAGKRWASVGLHAGMAVTDVRLKGGTRYYTVFGIEDGYNRYYSCPIPESRTTFTAPVGGIEIRANDKTWIMAELESIPVFDFNVGLQNVVVSRTWLGIAGIRFFMAEWLALDVGVKTQSVDKGIADAEIRIGGSCIVPVTAVVNRIKRNVRPDAGE
jgi:hypothetical protein